MGKVIRLSVDIKILSPRGCLPLPGAIYIYKIIKYVYKIRFLFLNLEGIGKVIRAFCCHRKFVPKGLYALATGLYTCIKNKKNVYKIRLRRDHFETCNMGKEKRPFCCHKIFVPNGLSALPGAIYM